MTPHLEISSLFEQYWTGIPTVVAAVVDGALKDDLCWRFTYDTIVLPDEFVNSLLKERTGLRVRGDLEAAIWDLPHVDYDEASRNKAVYTSVKTTRGLFDAEAMLVYDLSPILTPQFHNQDTISHFANRLRGDVETSDHFFPISAATRGDLEVYLGVERKKCSILPMGVNMDLHSVSLAQELARCHTVEPYIVVLGTLEPRKNGALVLQYLARNPGFADRFKVVFVGRDGWLMEKDRLLLDAERAGVPPDRIVFTGFLDDRDKTVLLYNASFCVYASFFEGFGLPVLEATVLGKLVVCSSASSMPEVAPDLCLFFDPHELLDFARAMQNAEKRCRQMHPALALPDVAERLSHHGWDATYGVVREWVLS